MRGLPIIIALTVNAACGSLVGELDRIRQKYEGGKCSVTISSVEPHYSTAPDWMHYVRRDGNNALDATGQLCTGAEGGHYGSCIHAGEMRRAKIDCLDSCSGVTLRDNLNAFYWRCVEQNGNVNAVSTGLRPDTGLAQLIDFTAAAWRPMALSAETPVGAASSTATRWFNNPIVLNPPLGNLGNAGTIYLRDSSPGGNYVISDHRVAFVGAPQVTLSGATGDFIAATGFNFLWVEGEFRVLADSDMVADLDNVKFSMLRHIRIQGTGSGNPTYARGVRLLNNSSANFIMGLTGGGFGDRLIEMQDSPRNTFYRILRHNGWHGIGTLNTGGGYDTIMVDFIGTNTTYQNIVQSTNNAGSYFQNGLSLFASSHNSLQLGSRATLMSHVTAGNSNTTETALLLNYGAGNILADNAIVHNSTRGLGAETANMYHYLTGLLLVGNNSPDCFAVANTGLTSACAPDGASDFSLGTSVSLATSFVGRVFQNDAQNASTATGGLTTGTPADWIHFSNRFRVWGRDGGDPGAAGNGGRCGSTCRVWDLSLRASDSVLRGRLLMPAPGDYLYHRWQPSTQLGCEAIRGAVWQDQVCSRPGYLTASACTAAGGTWSTGLCTTKLLRHAQELFFDGRGNDNGLCESGEACLYTPNIGAYQGHGNLVYAGRVNGTGAGEIQDVDLWRYEVNGR